MNALKATFCFHLFVLGCNLTFFSEHILRTQSSSAQNKNFNERHKKVNKDA